jgi:hypothetical protein
MMTSTTGKILVAFVFASMIGCLSVGPALGDDNDRRRQEQNRREHDRWEHQRGRCDNGVWRENGGWRDNRGGWHAYQPVCVPPPVVYGPSPSPGISIFFPFFR